MTHICVIGRSQAIISTSAGILLIRSLGTNFRAILSKIPIFSSKKMHLKMSSAKWWQFYLGFNVLRDLLTQVEEKFPRHKHGQRTFHIYDQAGCLSRYGDSYYKHKTVVRPSYLYNGNAYT